MRQVVVVAPYFGGTMLRFLDAVASLSGVRLGIVTHEPRERIPARLGDPGHYRVGNALDPRQVVAAVRAFQREWGAVDRLVGYLEPLQVPLGDVRDACGIEGVSGAVARNFRDKNRMKGVLRDAGLPVARQALVRGAADALRFIDEVGYPVVLKPLDGAGAKGTFRVRHEGELYRVLHQLLPSDARPVQAEQFVTGQEHTFETVCIDGEPVWSSSTDYLPGPLAVLENPWMQYCVVLPRERRPHVEAFRDTNAAALKALGLQTGLSHMEWFRRSDGAVTIGEVGARPPGVNIMDLNGIVHGVDLWKAWAELQVFDRWPVPDERKAAAGCAFLRAQGPGRTVREVHHRAEVEAVLGDRIVAARWPRPGQPRSSHYEGDGYVMVRHESTEGVMDALEKLVRTVRVSA